MALAYSDVTVELKEVSLKNRPQELFDVSSKGTVPVLCIDSSTIIDESLDIMIWALNYNDPENWIEGNKQSQLDMIVLYDNEFKHWLDRYKYYERYPENEMEYYRQKCDHHLSELDILLSKNHFIISDNLSLVDVAIFPFVRQFANVNNNWFIDNYPNVSSWLDNFIESKLFLSVMEKYQPCEDKPLIINFNEN